MPIDEQLLEAEGLTKAEIRRVKHYVEAAGEEVRPEVMNLPDTIETWIMSHHRELKDELLAMAERGEPCPSPDTLLGRALRMFTTELCDEDDLD